MKKIVCFLLIACMLCASLVACDDGGAGTDGGDKNGAWANLDFKDATLSVSVSINDPFQTTFQNSAVYMKGPDNAATSEPVQKKVLARNKKVCDDLNIKIEYQETDWRYDEVLPHLELLVGGAAEDAPDVYNNDILGIFRAMMNGYLWNITDPGRDAKGNEVKSYFDLDHECWYKEYMEGATFSKEKQYILIGDFNIDIVRFAWVFFVNIDRWDATFSNLSEDDGWGFNTYESACEYIEDTQDWFYDDVIALADIAHVDGSTGVMDKTDKTDEQIGIALNALSSRLFTYGSGYSVFEWTKNGKAVGEGEGVPSMITDTTNLGMVGDKFTEMYNSKGVLPFRDVELTSTLDSTIHFMDGKTIMATANLGEMESQQMRAVKFKRGILPYPRYSRDIENITTVVHDQAEVSVILNNAKNFSMASAYLQYVNEESIEILDFYYEEVLKFKYNDSKGARKMIDMVHDTVTTPFEALMALYLYSEAGVKPLHDLVFVPDSVNNRQSTLRSKWAEVRDTLQSELEEMYAKFLKLE